MSPPWQLCQALNHPKANTTRSIKGPLRGRKPHLRQWKTSTTSNSTSSGELPIATDFISREVNATSLTTMRYLCEARRNCEEYAVQNSGKQNLWLNWSSISQTMEWAKKIYWRANIPFRRNLLKRRNRNATATIASVVSSFECTTTGFWWTGRASAGNLRQKLKRSTYSEEKDEELWVEFMMTD